MATRLIKETKMSAKEREVIGALRNGEKLRVGYFDGLKALWEDGEAVDAKVIRSLKKKGAIEITRDGFVRPVAA
jgi:hypothetical protein